MNRSFFRVCAVAALVTCYGCGPAPQQPEATATEDNTVATEAVATTAATATPAPNPFADFNTSLSVKDLMNAVINRNARQLWASVSYVETEQGAVEIIPQTQEDWDQLRTNAMALVEGANALMLPGRKIDAAENLAVTPDFQFTPAEIEQLLRDDPDNWIINLQNMQDTALATLEVINRKDILGLTERGARINEACETCHAQYWYRPLAAPR